MSCLGLRAVFSFTRTSSALATCLVTGVLVGCATVNVKKVPSPAQYVIDGKNYWTPAMQQEADKLEGFRFYLPRPFVSVFESFPVATDIYLGKGRVSPDGRYVAIDSIMPLSTREDFAAIGSGTARALPGDLQIPRDWIFRPGAAASQAGQQKPGEARAATEGAPLSADAMRTLAEVTEASRDSAAKAEKQTSAAQNAAAEAATSAGNAKGSAQQVTGQSRRGVSNDNGAFAYQPLRGNFDLVYMPDFDEQYVVSSQSGLGNAQFQVNLGQGWSLQGFNSFTDNSALTKRVFDVIDTGLELGKAAARAAALSAGIPLPGEARAGVEAPPLGLRMDNAPGTPVALKIVVLHYAAKGLYPVIKPRELIARGSAAMVIDLAAPTPTLRRLNDGDLARALAEHTRLEQRSTVPVYPYQYISFNTFRYMAIEVLTPQGSPFGTPYDKTGTTGDSGDRRATEPPGSPGTPAVVGDDVKLKAALSALESEAKKVANEQIAAANPNDQRKALSARFEIVQEGTARAVSGDLKLSGSPALITEDLKKKITDALDKLIAENKEVTQFNRGTPMHLSKTFPITVQQ
jgi:hypothetical protein